MRELLQEQYSEQYINGARKGVFLISMRFGKTILGIKILQKLKAKKVLICYPFSTIQDSWIGDFAKMEWQPEEIIYSTFRSLDKNIDTYDVILVDEIHLLSEHQRTILRQIVDINENVLGLTGTLSEDTKYQLINECGLGILAEYTTEQAVEQDIIADYRVNIITYKLDDTSKYLKKTKKKQWWTTEKKELGYLSRRLNSLLYAGEDAKFVALQRMRFINNCNSLKKTTLKLLKKLENNRLLVFGASTDFVDGLDIPTYHYKSKENTLDLFQKQVINKLGLAKLANQGVTFFGLTDAIVTSIDSNSENLLQKLGRTLVKEGDKIGNIWIIVSDEEFQLKWLNKATEFIPKDKIKYVEL